MTEFEGMNLEKTVDRIENVKNNCEYILDEIAIADEDNFEDACIYATSMIDSITYILGLCKSELRKGIKE